MIGAGAWPIFAVETSRRDLELRQLDAQHLATLEAEAQQAWRHATRYETFWMPFVNASKEPCGKARHECLGAQPALSDSRMRVGRREFLQFTAGFSLLEDERVIPFADYGPEFQIDAEPANPRVKCFD